MIRSRLHLQIYATIILSLILVVVLTGLSLWVSDHDDFNPQVRTVFARVVMEALPETDAPAEEQNAALVKLLEGLDVDASIFTPNGDLITFHGYQFTLDKDQREKKGWRRYRSDHGWVAELPDGRTLIAGIQSEDSGLSSFFGFLMVLSSITLGIGLASYPLVRRLTRRLENLQAGVEKVGSGDLKTRVAIEGKDEIATLAASFNHATEQIETLITSHKTLLANASHELRTPLARIQLGLEMYHENHDAKRLTALRSDIGELDTLIEEILLMSRLDDASVDLVMAQVDLMVLVQTESQHFSDVTISGSIGQVDGNVRLLQRMVRNLIGNAFKHGAPPVAVTFSQTNETISMTVTDNGNGVPVGDRDKVFERFYRGSDRQNVEGYGLGLPLVKQITEAHKGSINVLDATGFSIQVTFPKTTKSNQS
jgi:signal transduction histidine kinase